MTLVINATVNDIVTTEEGNTFIHFSAVAGEDVVVKNSYKDTNGVIAKTEYTVKQINSNTEGNVLKAEVSLMLEGSEAPLEIGQVVSFSASFSKKVE